VSSASLPFSAALYTALPIESFIASAALYARTRSATCGFGGGHARLRGDAREAAARTPSRCACAARPQAPRSSGGGGSRGARARRGRSKRPWRAAATPGSRGPEQRGMGVRSSCGSQGPERVRCRPSGSTRAQGARVGSDPRSIRGQRPSDFPRPRRREACRADAHGNRPPSQLVGNPARRVSGRERSEGQMER
jgi:hypothetical protein